MVRGAVGNLGFDLQRHLDLGADQAHEMGDDLVGDLTGVESGPHRIEGHGAVETSWPSGGWCVGRFVLGPKGSGRSFADGLRPITLLSGWRLCLGALRVKLTAGNVRLHQQAGGISVGERDHPAGSEATIALGLLVVAFGEGE